MSFQILIRGMIILILKQGLLALLLSIYPTSLQLLTRNPMFQKIKQKLKLQTIRLKLIGIVRYLKPRKRLLKKSLRLILIKFVIGLNTSARDTMTNGAQKKQPFVNVKNLNGILKNQYMKIKIFHYMISMPYEY